MFTNRTIYWISIDIANQMGYDKLKFPQRIDMVEQNVYRLREFNTALKSALALEKTLIVENEKAQAEGRIFMMPMVLPVQALVDELKLEKDFAKIESELEFINGVNALFEVVDTGYTAHMVYLDASNQALQLYSIVTRCKQTALTCNLANLDEIADAYQLLANALNDKLDFDFTRSDCKYAVMTKMYNKLHPCEEIIADRWGGSVDAMVQELNITLEEFDGLVNEALYDIAPKAILAMESLSALNNENVGTYYWTMPDGMNVKYDVKADVKISANVMFKHNVPFVHTYSTKIFQASDKNRGMSPNMIHSIDGYVVREMIRRMNGKFMTTIHDAFACHPSDCDLLVQNYRDILCELLQSTIIDDIATEVAGTQITIKKSDDLTCEDIQNSTYLLG